VENETSQKKDKSILIRLTNEEKEAVHKAAGDDSISVSEYIRRKLLDVKQANTTQPEAIQQYEEHIQTLKEQVVFLQEQNRMLQSQNKSFQHEQLDVLQKLLLLNTPQIETTEDIIEEPVKPSFFRRMFYK